MNKMAGYKDYILTGHKRYRATRKGNLILQVKEVATFSADYDNQGTLPPWDGRKECFWRDAKVEDLTNTALKDK